MLGMGVFIILFVQNVLLFEDFVNGIFVVWINEDVFGNGVIWIWCNDLVVGQGDGCFVVWNDQINQQMLFVVEIVMNGFVMVDFDVVGGVVIYISELIIVFQDFLVQDVVWIVFQVYIGVFVFFVEDNVIFCVSNDGGINWDIYMVFFGLIIGECWLENLEQIQFDILVIVVGEFNVFIQWQWIGNWEYNWNFDDVFIYDVDLCLANDMCVNNFYVVVFNFVMFVFQVILFGFIVDIQNLGV